MKGFTGTIAANFSNRTNEAISKASEVHNKNPFEGRNYIRVQPPRLSSPLNQQAPFAVEGSNSVRHFTGVGNSTNIVMEQALYTHVVREVDKADDNAGENIYKCCIEIEQMCQNIFVVPETISRILAITGQVKSSLGQFRSMTEEINIHTRNFARAMTEIDGSETFAASEQGLSNAISTARNVIDRQADSMSRTSQNFKTQVTRLQQDVSREVANIDRIDSRLDRAYSRRDNLVLMSGESMPMMASFTNTISAFSTRSN